MFAACGERLRRGYNRGGAVLVSCIFSLFFHVGKQEEEHMRHHARVARLHNVSYNIQTQRGVKRQFTITQVGERWVDSGGESWAELNALKMKRIESKQVKMKNTCQRLFANQTLSFYFVVVLSCISFIMQTERARRHRHVRVLNILPL